MSTPSDKDQKPNQLVVLKFGGTSVASRARWDVICDVAKARIHEGFRPLIVCSALTGVSNMLERAIGKSKANQNFEDEWQSVVATHTILIKELDLPSQLIEPELSQLQHILQDVFTLKHQVSKISAKIMSFGELLSTKIGQAYLQRRGISAKWHDARDSLMASDESSHHENRQYLSANCDFEKDNSLRDYFLSLQEDAVITQGFIAKNRAGDTVLLGRGGSDTSAAYFAAKLSAVRCEIWTDVPGLFTANPREIETARILNSLNYDEAQEMATLGAKVLHPKTIPPVKKAGIPLHIKCTSQPDHPGTVISDDSFADSCVKCIATKKNVSLISIESLGMWQEIGFLADIFGIFKTLGLSVDLVSTSETNVTISVDSITNVLDPESINSLVSRLSVFGKVSLMATCASVSLIGKDIRSILHHIGPALSVFESQKVYLVSQAANDLNLSFVVQEDAALQLARDLHRLLFDRVEDNEVFGEAWQKAPHLKSAVSEDGRYWWRRKALELIDLAKEYTPLYVYNLKSIEESISELKKLKSVDRIFYAMKANDAAPILKKISESGLGFECVSKEELEHLFNLIPNLDPRRVLFTPNFASKHEYEAAVQRECHVTLDNLFPLEKWPELFRNKKIILRIDPGYGLGHHKHVKTAGERSKFGISQSQINKAHELARECQAKVTGLHVHAGSGIRLPSHWADMAEFLLRLAPQFQDLEILNLGGGFDVPSELNDESMNLREIDDVLMRVRNSKYQFWIEPGRFLVANSGVLLTRVTQLKEKGKTKFVGVDAGMNALLRPALYGAHHQIWNLSRVSEVPEILAHVVGPICESGDVLGSERRLPKCEEGDVMLIETAGAYGRVMSSKYNRRKLPKEHFLEE